MIDQMIDTFKSFFQDPSAWGIGLAIVFGAVWLAGYRPPLFKKPWLWAVIVGSAFLTLAALCFVQTPIWTWIEQELSRFWTEEGWVRWILLAGVVQVLLGGLVQEGAKLVPVVVYWWRTGRNIDPKLGLVIGAVAGAGFGIFETQWAFNALFDSGWTWATHGGSFMALIEAGFWYRFFIVAGHIALPALAGYGLARGWGWQFYLVASVLHGLLDYSIVLFMTDLFTIVPASIYVAVVAVLVTAWALWLRWRKTAAATEAATSAS